MENLDCIFGLFLKICTYLFRTGLVIVNISRGPIQLTSTISRPDLSIIWVLPRNGWHKKYAELILWLMIHSIQFFMTPDQFRIAGKNEKWFFPSKHFLGNSNSICKSNRTIPNSYWFVWSGFHGRGEKHVDTLVYPKRLEWDPITCKIALAKEKSIKEIAKAFRGLNLHSLAFMGKAFQLVAQTSKENFQEKEMYFFLWLHHKNLEIGLITQNHSCPALALESVRMRHFIKTGFFYIFKICQSVWVILAKSNHFYSCKTYRRVSFSLSLIVTASWNMSPGKK